MMGTRILAGEFRGVPVGPIPKSIFARPILARIRKSLFDILSPKFPDVAFLDLFSGSGTVGLEAVSRGAGPVICIDKNPQCRRWIDDMLKNFSARNPQFMQARRAQVHCADVTRGLRWLNAGFDIIFSGAPYVDEKRRPLYFISDLLRMIHNENLLNEKGWFVAQHQKKEPIEISEPWTLFRQEQYGDTMLSFFKKNV